MKIERPIFAVRVVSDNLTEMTLSGQLRTSLRSICSKFLHKTDRGDADLLEAAQELTIAQRIAVSQYITGVKIQNFANNAANNDTITLQEEINKFIKEFNKVIK